MRDDVVVHCISCYDLSFAVKLGDALALTVLKSGVTKTRFVLLSVNQIPIILPALEAKGNPKHHVGR